ncbi:lipopolysaccharide assembly protein LapA domain-containing protein [Desemzia sp. FAM 23989]|uniref:lipopolysaccharide assembly protein LapA domain-containing protein n=1 Tax=Desemzia sp. FAM 23989 TaxID=3259523 RepID=UPI00388BA66B
MGLAISIILLLLAAALIFLNIDATLQLNLGFTEMTVPLWAVMVGFLVIGLVAAWLMALSKERKNKETLKEKDEKLRDQDDKVRIADKTKEEAVVQAKRESESELIRKNAEIEGLKKQIDSLEDELNRHLPNHSTSGMETSTQHQPVEAPITRTEKQSTEVQVEPSDKRK